MKQRVLLVVVTVLMAFAMFAAMALATPEKAQQTGKGCQGCHPNAGPHAAWYHR